MIDIRTSVIGDREIVAKLRQAPEKIQFRLLAEMSEIGGEITDAAQGAVPVKSGALRRAIRYTVAAPRENVRLEVKHSGKGARHAHLIERGVERQQIEVRKKVMAQRVSFRNGKARKGRVWRVNKKSPEILYQRWHVVRAQPYFMPAVESAGDVNARLQEAVTAAARDVEGA